MDTIVLIEEDSLYIGHPRPPAIDPYDGTIYVSDTYWKRVLRIDRRGKVVQVYGRPGSGPGEFEFNALVFVPDDSTIAVVDERAGRLKYFDRESGRFRDERLLPIEGYLASGSSIPIRIGDDLWFPWLNPSRRKGLARWDPSEDSIAWLGELPADYHRSRNGRVSSYANHMFIGALTRAGTTLVRGWLPMNELFLYDVQGQIVDSLNLPVVRRRGVPDDIRRLYDVELISVRERLTTNSRLRQLHTLPDGSVAFIHHDQEILSMDGPLPVVAAHVWLGLVSPDFDRACVDTSVPASLDARSAEAFRGDTLFVLDRRITGEGQVKTRVVLYRIDPQGCDWIPLERG